MRRTTEATMSHRCYWRRTAGFLTVLLALSIALVGCEKEKEYQDEKPPTTGELEVEPDETEFEAERELAEGEQPPVPEGEYDVPGAQGKIEVEDDEVEVEVEQEFAEGANPAFDPNAPDEQDIELEGTGQQQAGQLAQPEPAQAVELTAVAPQPANFIGATVKGTVQVESVISDRGFWVTSDGNRIFAVLREAEPPREKIDINAGQTLSLTGLLVDGEDYNRVIGTFEADAKQALKEQPYFIAAFWKDIEITQGGSGS